MSEDVERIAALCAFLRQYGDEKQLRPTRFHEAADLIERLSALKQPDEVAVERVARAISDANWRPEAGKEFLDERWADELLRDVAMKQARAALAALNQEETP